MIGKEGLCGVPAGYIQNVWPLVIGYLEGPITLTPDCLPEDILKSLVNAEMQLWIIGDGEKIIGAMVSEILISPRTKVLSVPYVGGEDDKINWPEIYEVMLDYARANECRHFRGYGRLGWIRKLQLQVKPLAYFTVGVE